MYATGGAGDGHVYLYENVIMMISTAYISGGAGDGFTRCDHAFSMNEKNNYFQGGEGDGFALDKNSYLLNIQQYANGGNGDGYALSRENSLLNSQHYVLGGVGDGFSKNRKAALFNIQQYVKGGAGDGFARTGKSTLYNIQQYAKGGEGDGFSSAKMGIPLNEQLYVKGGSGDGQDKLFFNALLGPGIWKGLVSSEWTEASNWLCNFVPDHTISVKIPSGCPHYPVLAGKLSVDSTSGIYTCKNLEILSGGSINTTSALSVSGNMTVRGIYVSFSSLDHSQNIFSGGTLNIYPSGIIKFGAQTSGEGNTDLIIHTGGTLSVNGGTLEIDDQLNLEPGSVFNMDSGMVFIHKYGRGSDYNVTDPGAFYAAPGSSGTISGGLLKVCGKSSSDTLSAINIASSTFSFSGTNTIEIAHGTSPVHYDTDIKTVKEVTFQNLVINKPGNTINLFSNIVIKGTLTVEQNSILTAIDGTTVIVGDSVRISH
jgi:hypothetical protein